MPQCTPVGPNPYNQYLTKSATNLPVGSLFSVGEDIKCMYAGKRREGINRHIAKKAGGSYSDTSALSLLIRIW